MDAEGIVNKYYRLITLTPSRKTTSLLLLVSILTFYTFVTTFPAVNLGKYAEGFFFYSIESLLFMLLLVPLRRSRIFNLKRMVNFVSAVLLMVLPAEIVLTRLGGLRGVGLSVSPGILVFVFIGLYEFGTAVALSALPTLLVLLIGTLGLGYNPYNFTISVISMSMASLVIGILALYSIEYFGRSRGVSPLSSARAFMKTWLTGDHGYLEELIRSLGVTDRVIIKALVFKRELGEPIALVFPDIHFGPFRNVGSSRFPYVLEDSLEPGMEAFIFHTPGSHERNVATFSESREIARAAASSISSYYGQLSDYGMCKPTVLREGEWEALVFRGPTAVVLFLTNVARGNDDLPYGIWRKAEEVLGANRKLNLVAVVDSHAAKGPPVRDVSELNTIIEKLNDIDRCSEENVYVGYGEAVGTGCRELCYDKVKAITFRFSDGERYIIVYIYGNNVDIQTRNNIVNLMKQMGFKEPLVVTPDDHSCAASFKEKPYYVVSDCPGLYEAVVKAVEKAVENEARARYVTIDHVFHNVELAGHNIWRLTSLIEDLGKKTLRSLLVTIAVVNLLALSVVLSF
ncbi:MAG: DUF2070 family protein [Sulfolobales archaeon]